MSEIERLKNENWALRRQLAETKRSLSWRLTAPLRALSRPYASLIRKFTHLSFEPAPATSLQEVSRAVFSAEVSTTDFVPYTRHENTGTRIKPIAFYLPQYHPIPENDQWWGPGFTEWNNVIAGRPRFPGHDQPRVPGEFGYYDLRVPAVMRQQVDLARNYGLAGFCFYYYWFSGKRLLEKPLDTFLNDPQLDLGFCLCWANENWTRRWDGLDQEILIGQKYSDRDRETFIDDLLPYFSDHRYIRIDNKPVLLIYRAHDIPQFAQWAKHQRERAVECGFPGVYLVGVRTNGFTDKLAVLCDACVEFPPHRLDISPSTDSFPVRDENFTGQIYSYPELVEIETRIKRQCPVPLYRTVFPSWDNEARRRGRGDTFTGSTPELYARWLRDICAKTEVDHPLDSRFVFINAWNEWSEAAYLEPDTRFGYAYLQATYECVASTKPALIKQAAEDVAPRLPRMAVLLHLFYDDLWGEIAAYLAHMPEDCDLVVTYSKSPDYLIVDRVRHNFPNARMLRVPNRGRDMLPFFLALSQELRGRFDLVCKIHTKRSVHRVDGDIWRQDMLNKLIGSPGHFRFVRDAFARDPQLGMLVPEGHYIDGSEYWGSNEQTVFRLAHKLGMSTQSFQKFRFCGGSMFWARGSILEELLALDLGVYDFEREAGQLDGTMANALERLIAAYYVSRGFSIAQISAGAELAGVKEASRYRFVD